MLSVIQYEYDLCCVSEVVRVFMLSAILVSVIMLKDIMLSVIMLSFIMLSVIMLKDIMIGVIMAPVLQYYCVEGI